MSKNITIIVPTFNRPRRLSRFLRHVLKSLITSGVPCSHLKIIIVDGSDSECENNNRLVDLIAGHGVEIFFLRKPGMGFLSRMALAAGRVKTQSVMVCGDDDLVDFSGLESWFMESGEDAEDLIYCGRFTNVIGLSIFGVILDSIERPYYGFDITSKNPLQRVIQYGTANAFGVTSLAYSIQPAWLFKGFWDGVDGDGYYYGGIEFMHQIYSMSRVGCRFVGKNIIFRDHSYIGYFREGIREAPASDRYPYHGESAVKKSIEYLMDFCGLGVDDAREAVESIISAHLSVLESRSELERNASIRGLRIVPETTVISSKNMKKVWRESYFSCYPLWPALKKMLALSLPNYIYYYLSLIIEKKRRAVSST